MANFESYSDFKDVTLAESLRFERGEGLQSMPMKEFSTLIS